MGRLQQYHHTINHMLCNQTTTCSYTMARLREAVDQAKCAFEEDVQKQNMEIANLKDTLLEARRASKGKKFIHKLKFDFVLSCILYYI